MTLSGFVPDETTAAATSSAARALGPAIRIEDQQKVAFGAPAGFSDLVATLMRDLGRLSDGKVALDDARFCVEGTAATPQAFLALRDGAAAAAPQGFTRVDCSLSPPTISPYRWSAEKSASGTISTSGYYPTEQARREILASLARAMPGSAAVSDGMLPAAGAPPAFAARLARAVADLARLRSGKVEIEGDVYRISGQGPDDHQACETLRLNIAQGDGPDSVALASISCPPPLLPKSEPAPAPAPPADASSAAPAPAAPPPTAAEPARMLQWRAEKSAAGIVLSGAAPSAAAKAAAAEAARAALSGGEVVDRTVLDEHLRGAPTYGEATRFALGLLRWLEQGSVTLAGSNLSLAGMVADRPGWLALDAALKDKALPAGLSLAGRPVLSMRNYGFAASLDRSGGYLTGYLPDAAARQAIAALIDASPLRGRINDETEILPAAPTGFSVAAQGAVQDLLRLDLGSASVIGRDVSVRGLTCRDLIRSEVETNLAGACRMAFPARPRSACARPAASPTRRAPARTSSMR